MRRNGCWGKGKEVELESTGTPKYSFIEAFEGHAIAPPEHRGPASPLPPPEAPSQQHREAAGWPS